MMGELPAGWGEGCEQQGKLQAFSWPESSRAEGQAHRERHVAGGEPAPLLEPLGCGTGPVPTQTTVLEDIAEDL